MIRIRVLQSTLVGATWHEPGVGPYDDDLAKFLIGLGVAEEIKNDSPKEVKKEEIPEKKPEKNHGSLSEADQASQKKTQKQPKNSKQSQSTRVTK